jgi:urea carboxylase-associated protein 2
MSRTAEQIAADRARYQENQRKGLEAAPQALPEPSALPADDIDDSAVLHRETVPGGWYWSTILRMGEALRINRPAGSSSIALVAWSVADPSERLNLPDTVKVQWTTAIGRGRVLFSDMGRVLLSVIEDSSGAHDALMGVSTAASNAARHGDTATRNGRDNLVLAAGKLGLDRRDIPAALSLFAPVRVAEDGAFGWHADLLHDGDFVELRAEMDVLVALSNTPHPLDPSPDYAPGAAEVVRFYAPDPAENDACRTATAEAVRGFENNTAALI